MATRTATTKPADDQPFDFNLDGLQPDVELRDFRVHFGGRRWTLKNMNELDAWDVVALAEGGDMKATVGALRLSLGDQWADFQKISLPQWKITRLFRAWREHSGNPNAGESSASSDS
jgi:hypothetical protein